VPQAVKRSAKLCAVPELLYLTLLYLTLSFSH